MLPNAAASAAAITCAPRPGLVWGSYPERPDAEESPTAQTLHDLMRRGLAWRDGLQAWLRGATRGSGSSNRYTMQGQTSADLAGARISRWVERVEQRLAALQTQFAALGVIDHAAPHLVQGGTQDDDSDDHSNTTQALRQTVLQLRAGLLRAGLTEALSADALAMVCFVAQRTLKMLPHRTQMIAVRILLDNQLAEMQTGEGKTLTAGLAAAVAALAGIPVHLITSNDYLVQRDAQTLRPLYQALGLSVGCAIGQQEDEDRRAAWGCDIAYCTAKELVFDFLRDRLVLGQRRGELHRRVDSVLNTSAGRGAANDVSAGSQGLRLRGLCMALIDEADSLLLDEATTPFILSEPRQDPDSLAVYQQALQLAQQCPKGLFQLQPAERRAMLTQRGLAWLIEHSQPWGGAWRSRRRAIELLQAALEAVHLYRRDRDYVVSDGKVHIVDENTGRVAHGRAWSRGIHQLIELREGCEPSPENTPVAQITFQRFFPRYLRLCGMSGTLREARDELLRTYNLPVVSVPLMKASRRKVLRPQLFANQAARDKAALALMTHCHGRGQPVLVGTDAVATSERLGQLLQAQGLPHAVLNARQDKREAAIVGVAGMRGQITVTTNMAGRGTDIKLGPGVAELGGLMVVSCQTAGSPRLDRQLAGRSARQGEPGGFVILMSLDDPLMRRVLGPGLCQRLAAMADRRGKLPDWLAPRVLAWVQWREQQRWASIRRRLARSDRQQLKWLAVGGAAE